MVMVLMMEVRLVVEIQSPRAQLANSEGHRSREQPVQFGN